MRPPYRHKLPVAIAVVVAGVALIGWVARSTRAQDRGLREPSPPTPATEISPVSPPPASSELPLPARDDGAPPLPAAKTTVADPIGLPDPRPAVPESDDPERKAQAFVEQNRKVAQDELKQLKDEAERLRARLGKVEGGIRRWEALVAALENGETAKRPAFKPVTTVVGPSALEPSSLEPIAVPPTGPQPR